MAPGDSYAPVGPIWGMKNMRGFLRAGTSEMVIVKGKSKAVKGN